MSQWRMCANEECERYRKATRLLGGCECGEPLVPFVVENEPTNEQLARLISFFSTSAPDCENISVEEAHAELDASPRLREAWLVRHGEVQMAIKPPRI